MAYKFQRGVSILSGSIRLDDDLSVSGSIALKDGSLSLSELDIDGGTDIGAALVDADLFIVDDGGAGTNRKSAMSRIPTYLVDHTSLTSLTSLVGVGALNAGSISTGFGNIDNGTSNITTGGKMVLDVDGTAINAAGALTMGAGSDAAIYFDGTNLVLDTAASAKVVMEVNGTQTAEFDTDGLNLVSGDAYYINDASVLNATTLGSAVVNSSLTSLGTQGEALDMGDYAIQNVGDIDCDSISVADAANGLDIDGSGANTGTFKISIKDNVANALDINQGGTSYIKFVTTDDGERIELGKGMQLASKGISVSADQAANIGKLSKRIETVYQATGSMEYLTGSGHGARAFLSKLYIGGTQVTSTAAELNLVDGSSSGAVVADKAAIHNSAGSLLVSDNAYIGAVGDVDMLQFDGGSEINVASDLDFIILKTGGLQLADGAVSATAAELNYNDITTLGSSQASKVLTADASGDITLVGAGANAVWDKSDDMLEFADDAGVSFGASGDLAMIHSSNANYINASATLHLAADTSGVAVNIGHSTSEVTIGDNLTVTGNLTVNGSTVTQDVTNLTIEDPLIKLGKGDTGTSNDKGIIFSRGNGSAADKANKGLIWDESADIFAFIACNEEDATTAGNVTIGGYANLKAEDITANGALQGDVVTSVGLCTVNGLKVTSQTLTAASATIDLANGGIIFVNRAAGSTLTLPNTSGVTSGEQVVIKDIAGLTIGSSIVLEGNGSQTVDGELNIALESPYAGLTLICDGSNWWVL